MRQANWLRNGSGAGVNGNSAAFAERQDSSYLHGLLAKEKVALHHG
jgi:hypothetical protein